MGRRPGSRNKFHVTPIKIDVAASQESVNKYIRIDIYFHERFKGWNYVVSKLVENNIVKITNEVYSYAKNICDNLDNISQFDLSNALVICETNERHIITIPISTFNPNSSAPKIITNEEAKRRKDVLFVK